MSELTSGLQSLRVFQRAYKFAREDYRDARANVSYCIETLIEENKDFEDWLFDDREMDHFIRITSYLHGQRFDDYYEVHIGRDTSVDFSVEHVLDRRPGVVWELKT